MTDESMEELFRTSDRLVGEVSMDFRRSLDIDWRDRLICIMGARGAGKTTLLRQHVREAFGVGSEKAVYMSLDDLWFAQYRALGNAIPPVLAWHVMKSVIDALARSKKQWSAMQSLS